MLECKTISEFKCNHKILKILKFTLFTLNNSLERINNTSSRTMADPRNGKKELLDLVN